MIRRIGSILVCLVFLSPLVVLESAEAGVLLRSGQVRSRVRTRTPRMRLGYSPASTWVSVSRKINPINSRTLTSEKALSRYTRKRERYIRELQRYERRKKRENKRLEKRRERERARQLRKEQREYARRALAEQNRKKDPSKHRESEGEYVETQNGDTSAVRIEGRKKAKPSFWSRFWQKLIGPK